ncbi:MAG TPA: DUF4907 domain-containing protein [Puia sp.]|nr:DUF4907 domain-containing protein [Puia sp.]
MAFLRKWGLSIGMLIVIIGTFSYGIYKRNKWKREHALMELRAIEVPNGWGYDILRDGSPYFHQNFIPGVTGNRVFRTKADALAVGEFICNKIKTGQFPMITEQEMRNMHIFIPPDTTSAADSTRYVDSVKVAVAAAAAKERARDSAKKSK